MKKFKEKLERLLENLKEAENEVDPEKACEILQKRVFGDDFPIPDKKETGKSRKHAFVPPSSSA